MKRNLQRDQRPGRACAAGAHPPRSDRSPCPGSIRSRRSRWTQSPHTLPAGMRRQPASGAGLSAGWREDRVQPRTCGKEGENRLPFLPLYTSGRSWYPARRWTLCIPRCRRRRSLRQVRGRGGAQGQLLEVCAAVHDAFAGWPRLRRFPRANDIRRGSRTSTEAGTIRQDVRQSPAGAWAQRRRRLWPAAARRKCRIRWGSLPRRR